MTTTQPTAGPTIRLSGPADLLDAVPYLLGFHPSDSLVLLGLDGAGASRLVVTVRMDLADLQSTAALVDSLCAMRRGGATLFVAVVYDGGQEVLADFADLVTLTAADLDCEVLDVLRVVGGRWWSLTCTDPHCCPPEGRPLASGTSQFSAEATYAGMAVLPDRAALAAMLAPAPDRERLHPVLDAAVDCGQWADDRAGRGADARAVDATARQILAMARDSGRRRWHGPSDEQAVRLGIALRSTEVRDRVWTAIDRGEVDGGPLWGELARRLPPPYDAAPAFLVGWLAWRAGNGALANVAADRALESDPDYSAAELLVLAVSAGLDPRRTPPLELGADAEPRPRVLQADGDDE